METKNKPPTSFSDLINQWGSVANFASDLGCEYQAARKMKTRNSIAPKYWNKLSDIARKKEIRGANVKLFSTFRETQGTAE
jgi:hypothetical protein